MRKSLQRKILVACCGVMALTPAVAQKPLLEQNFAAPPDTVKPGIYYYWLSDNISEEGVRKDIEAMAKLGIGRAFIGNIGLDETPYGKVKLFSDEWWKIMKLAIKTGTKEGVDIGLFNGPGWSQSGGPWIKPEESMRYLYSQEWQVKGDRQLTGKFHVSKENFQSVAWLAFPEPAGDHDVIALHHPVITSSPAIPEIGRVADNDTSTFVHFPASLSDTSVFFIDLRTPENFTARSLVLYLAPDPVQAMVSLQVRQNGVYETIRQFEADRSNPAKNVGFIPYAPIAIAFDAVTAKQYRLVFSKIDGQGGIAEIQLSAAPRVERFEEKQLAKMFQTPHPMWDAYQWKPQAPAGIADGAVDLSRIVNLDKYLSADGTLNWKVPAGNWIIARYGMLPTGVTNAPATPEGRGLEVDKMSRQALVSHFDSFVGKIQKRLPPADARSLKYVVADSYETGSENWTDGMAPEFKKRYGYDPLPWLPVLAGRIVGTADESNRFLWDLRRMVADKIAYDYVGGLRDISHRHGLKIWLENYGHWGFPSEFLMYGGQSDEVGGEFWNEGDLGSIECRDASSAAHIYGKTKVSAESFTAGGLTYVRYPALLKRRGDWSFTEGINNTVLHVYVEQAYERKNPGVNAGFGTEFNRKNTWFSKGKAFVDYIRRCNYLLQQGKPIDDVAYFIGEDAPKMTGIRDPALPAGYQFDYINAEVIEKRLSVKDGRLVLPDGMSYRLLVLPPGKTMRPELLKRIRQLVYEGAVVLGTPPTHSPSLKNYPEADKQVREIASELWGSVDGERVKLAHYGKGLILEGMTMEDAMKELNVAPDFSLQTPAPVLYTHRRTGNTDIYFITNQADTAIAFSASFRVNGKQPEWWDAVTGLTRPLPEFSKDNRRTVMPLKLDPYQSGFVVFKKNAGLNTAGKTRFNFPVYQDILQLHGPWKISFDTAMGGPEKPVVLHVLEDWSKSDIEQIKNYSGTAVYRTEFQAGQLPAHEQLFLNLGNVKVMATVKLNGKNLGTVWTAPWQVDATKAIREGRNTLEIEVVNTWVNRLIGDSKLPEAERRNWVNVDPYTPESEYEPSGLIGPVILRAASYSASR